MPSIKLLRDCKIKRPAKKQVAHIIIDRSRSNYWNKYYQSALWKTTRLVYKNAHPLCEKCLDENRITPMKDVHHKCKFGGGQTEAERWRILTDQDNLVALCSACHHEVHATNDPKYITPLKVWRENYHPVSPDLSS